MYTGEYYDETVGLYYLKARYMNPSAGAFISRDSYQGDINNPITLNKYTYANSNPVAYRDPSGNMGIACGAGYFTITTTLREIVALNIMGMLGGIVSTATDTLLNGSDSTPVKSFIGGYFGGFALGACAAITSVVTIVNTLKTIVMVGSVGLGALSTISIYTACIGKDLTTQDKICITVIIVGSLAYGKVCKANVKASLQRANAKATFTSENGGEPVIEAETGEAGGDDGVVLTVESEGGTSTHTIDNSVDLTDFRKDHILNNHRYGAGKPDKTEFPQNWSDEKILHYVSDVATDPNATWGMGKWDSPYAISVREGIEIRVDFYPDTHPRYSGKISTAYPLNTPKNPSKGGGN